MSKKKPKSEQPEKEPRRKTPTLLLELPLVVNEGQAKRIRGHLEAGRALYNAVLSQGQKRLRQMRADPAWQAARSIPPTQKPERQAAFSALRQRYGFSEYALHEYAKTARVCWIADHLDAVLAQTLATRAYQALNRVCVGEARRVRFKSRGRGLASLENKRNDTGLRFVLQKPEEGHRGFLIWKDDQLEAVIDWEDEVVAHGLRQRIKYARLVQRRASSERAAGADARGDRYVMQLALEGVPHRKKKHAVGNDIIGADLGPSTIALVPRAGEASLSLFCEELAPDEQAIRRQQRRMDRQRRAANRSRTMTSVVASRSRGRNDYAGRRARATSVRAGARRPENASWQPIARVCMVNKCMRSSRSATQSFWKRSRTKRGKSSMARA